MQEKSEELLPESAFTEVSESEKRQLFRQSRSAEELLAEEPGRSHNQVYLINKLNYANFLDKPILVNFKHPKYGKSINCEARPSPCINDRLDCSWLESPEVLSKVKAYQFHAIFVPDGVSFLVAEPQLLDFNQKSIRFKLPEICHEVSTRKFQRQTCFGIDVQFSQHGSLFKGTLIDFSAFSLHVQISADPPQTFQLINPEDAVAIHLFSGKEILFSGECTITGHSKRGSLSNYYLKPSSYDIHRYNPKKFRSHRLTVNPTPDAVFEHPFTKKLISLKVVDISGSGFSVEENEKNPVLLPGLIIPRLSLRFAMGISIDCRAQVVYVKTNLAEAGDEQAGLKCGFAFLDMDAQQHAQLLSYLHQAENKNAYICSAVDLDSLWDFFFETGFIYPDKYEFIEKHKERVKDTYEKVYTKNLSIARHLTYQQKGQILGHIAIVRYYTNTWLIHHHAARTSSFNKGGLVVLDNVGSLIYDAHRLHSLHMHYVMCFYRSENKFPNRVFGGVAKSINNSNACSIDTFAYLHFQPIVDDNLGEIDAWEIDDINSDDLAELEIYYDTESGGLMLDAFDLRSTHTDIGALVDEYRKADLIRDRTLLSLRQNGKIHAVIMVNKSDIGLNLSDLTNSVTVILLEPDEVSDRIFKKTLSSVFKRCDLDNSPVLFYPASFGEERGIRIEKKYNLWIMDASYCDHYFKYLKKLLKFI